MADRPRVFVARRIPDDGLDLIRDACEMELWDDELPPPREELLRAVAGCDGILTLLTERSTASSSTPPAPSSRSSRTSPSATTTSTSRRAPGAASRTATRPAC